MQITRLFTGCLIALLFFATHVHALSLGASAGIANLNSVDASSIEKAYPNMEKETYSPTWSFGFQLQYRLNDFFFGEIGLSELSYLEKRQTADYPADDKGARKLRFTSKESLAAVHASVGVATSFAYKLSGYLKIGPSVHQSAYTLRQAIIQDNKEVETEIKEDSQVNNIYDLRLYTSIGALYEINENYAVRLEYEDFGNLGRNAKIETFRVRGTNSFPLAGGVHVKRLMIGILYHIF